MHLVICKCTFLRVSRAAGGTAPRAHVQGSQSRRHRAENHSAAQKCAQPGGAQALPRQTLGAPAHSGQRGAPASAPGWRAQAERQLETTARGNGRGGEGRRGLGICRLCFLKTPADAG